ncbi:SDR family NAD(P)-dependent oxidoreductase [Kribbella sp. NPDC026611]|uniref:SDR family NAD(P)-dependent oxidoreductase n=1 Tax=Kribbella sp. NPDC026611 TaxID=3154911 RepID=UPI0033C8FBFE
MRPFVWISGASSGIGAALAASVPFPDARVIDLSRTGGCVEHFKADLSDPADWLRVEQHFTTELASYTGDRVVFIHNAGTISPIGPAEKVGRDAYTHAVLLNSAAPQILGSAFLRASAHLSCPRHLILISSGAAKTPYAGWSSYSAGKAASEQWVRTVALELPPTCQVLAVAPGVVDTPMQSEIRSADVESFPSVARFQTLKSTGALSSPETAASGIWSLLTKDLPNGSCVDLRNL